MEANQVLAVDKVIARNAYDTIRVYDIDYGINDEIIYSSWRSNHKRKDRAVIQYNPKLDINFFIDGCDEMEEIIYLNELIRI